MSPEQMLDWARQFYPGPDWQLSPKRDAVIVQLPNGNTGHLCGRALTGEWYLTVVAQEGGTLTLPSTR
jgi:hypothetical protein